MFNYYFLTTEEDFMEEGRIYEQKFNVCFYTKEEAYEFYKKLCFECISVKVLDVTVVPFNEKNKRNNAHKENLLIFG